MTTTGLASTALGMDQGPLGSLFSAQSAAKGVVRCGFFFTFIAAGLLGKAMLTSGLPATMTKMLATTWQDVEEHITDGKVLRNVISRGLLAAVFQLVGWSLIGIAAEAHTDLNIGRRKRSHEEEEFLFPHEFLIKW